MKKNLYPVLKIGVFFLLDESPKLQLKFNYFNSGKDCVFWQKCSFFGIEWTFFFISFQNSKCLLPAVQSLLHLRKKCVHGADINVNQNFVKLRSLKTKIWPNRNLLGYFAFSPKPIKKVDLIITRSNVTLCFEKNGNKKISTAISISRFFYKGKFDT